MATAIMARVPATDGVAAAEETFKTLAATISAVIGMAGYRALFGRARHLATAEHPWLSAADLGPDGSIHLQHAGAASDAILRDGTLCLLAHVLGILCDFIGDDLTYRLLRRVWTDLPAAHGST
jgi:hypothetical protein